MIICTSLCLSILIIELSIGVVFNKGVYRIGSNLSHFQTLVTLKGFTYGSVKHFS